MFPFETDRQDRPWFLLLAGTALAEVIILFAVMWHTAAGHFMLPLDDSYIHLQYARQLAAGEPLVYTHGMAPSGGMTSPLYSLLLTPALFLGLDGARGAFVAFLFGAALWMLLPIWVYQLTTRLANCLCGLVAAALVLANGHILWNFLSGMETALFTMLALGAALAAQCWWQAERPYARVMFVACLALLPLARPEGILLVLLAIAIVLLRRGAAPRLSIVPLLAALVPFAIWLCILRIATGDWRPAGLTVKGLTAHPILDWPDRFGILFETWSAIAFKFHANLVPDPAYAAFKGTISLPYIPVGVGLLAATGGAMLVVMEWRVGRPAGGTLTALTWIVGLASIGASALPFIHQQRYLAPWTVFALILAVTAIRRIGQLFQQLEEPVIKALAIALAVISFPSLGFWMAEYGRNSRDIYHLLREATFRLQEERRPIALTDAGALAYYTAIPVYDFVGLTSPEFTTVVLQGEGALIERLARLPENSRPVALVSYRSWFSPEFPVGSPEWTVTIPTTTITSGTVLQRFPIEWDAIERGLAPPFRHGAVTILDLDIADIDSEEAAVYTSMVGPLDRNHRAWPQPLSPIVQFMPAPLTMADPESTGTLTIAAAGMAVEGIRVVRREKFQFSPTRPHRDKLLLLARVGSLRAGDPFLQAAANVRISVTSRRTGHTVSTVAGVPDFAAVPYSELEVRLADLLDSAGGDAWWITVESEPPGGAWLSGHYWILNETKENAGGGD